MEKESLKTVGNKGTAVLVANAIRTASVESGAWLPTGYVTVEAIALDKGEYVYCVNYTGNKKLSAGKRGLLRAFIAGFMAGAK